MQGLYPRHLSAFPWEGAIIPILVEGKQVESAAQRDALQGHTASVWAAAP